MLRVLLTILLATVFSACATPGPCPPLIEYDDEFQETLVEELRRLPDDYEAIPWVIQDYRITRDQLELCQ